MRHYAQRRAENNHMLLNSRRGCSGFPACRLTPPVFGLDFHKGEENGFRGPGHREEEPSRRPCVKDSGATGPNRAMDTSGCLLAVVAI